MKKFELTVNEILDFTTEFAANAPRTHIDKLLYIEKYFMARDAVKPKFDSRALVYNATVVNMNLLMKTALKERKLFSDDWIDIKSKAISNLVEMGCITVKGQADYLLSEDALFTPKITIE